MSGIMQRWRLVLGKHAQGALGLEADERLRRMETALDFLYSREYKGRGMRERGGTLDPSQLTVPSWLGEIRRLFPRETSEIIEKHALDRYGMSELIADKEVLAKLEPNMDLLKALLTFRGLLKGEVLSEARRIVRQVAEELRQKLESEVRQALAGRMDKHRQGRVRTAANLDWRRTIRRNLRNFDPQTGRLGIQELSFFSRVRQHIPWHVILCVDQSGSMTDSVVHSAVMAGILAGLPSLRVKLVVFDTSIVDLSDHLDDPVETLLSVQLGGGTDIGQALCYCEGLIDTPQRTIVVLVSDFIEGGGPARMLGSVTRMREAGVRLIGLAALGQDATPSYDRQMAERLAGKGMDIAALTPGQLANWLGGIIR